MRRSYLKFGLAAAVVVLASGCATGPKHSEVAARFPAVKSGEGRIYFYRNSTFGAAVQPEIRLNGQVVGKSQPNGFFFVDRAAGNYVASSSTETEKTLSFTLQPGETKYVKSSIGFGLVVGRAVLDLVAPTQGAADISNLSYTGTLAGK
ncbi:MAG TPA: DUF2846 domain-containing protein [Ramlibacter sp.]|uniref:DUF2846 domain-containing protein n=1 Tax=Ramlibacter sp. TaxID=1917967 RepID=UPI002D807D8B|nr:DUF2846 domain-containing protein [Ramlibacter sp.]HET8746802.1 DUF2846 domain-containing protein [Ramlibacter sp.]